MEVLLALLILTVGLLAIAQLQVAAIHTLTFSRHMTTATQIGERQLEFLRSVPVPVNPASAPLDASGNPYNDKNGNSILLDDSSGGGAAALGDGLPSSWHELIGNPINELGASARSDEMKYYVRWTIERGPTTSAGAYNAGTNTLTIPSPGQIAIVIQVIWWESNKDVPAMVDLQTLDNTGMKNTHAHHVELQTVRTSDL